MKITRFIKLFVLVLFTLMGLAIARLVYNMFSNSPTASKEFLKDHQSLFNKKAKRDLLVFSTVKSRNRQPVLTATNSEGYDILIYSVTLNENFDLRESVKLEKSSSASSIQVIYSAKFGDNGLLINLKQSGTTDTANYLNISYDKGEVKQYCKDSTMMAWRFSRFNNMSLKFDEDPFDLLVKSDRGNNSLTLCLIRKRDKLYILVAFPNQKADKLLKSAFLKQTLNEQLLNRCTLPEESK